MVNIALIEVRFQRLLMFWKGSDMDALLKEASYTWSNGKNVHPANSPKYEVHSSL